MLFCNTEDDKGGFVSSGVLLAFGSSGTPVSGKTAAARFRCGTAKTIIALSRFPDGRSHATNAY